MSRLAGLLLVLLTTALPVFAEGLDVKIEGETDGLESTVIAGLPRFLEERHPGILGQNPRVVIRHLGAGRYRSAYAVRVAWRDRTVSYCAKVDLEKGLSKDSSSFKESKNYELLAGRFAVEDPQADLPFARLWSIAEIDGRWVQMCELIPGADLRKLTGQMAKSGLSRDEKIRRIWEYSYALGKMTGDFYYGMGGWLPGDLKASNVVWDEEKRRFVDVDYGLLIRPNAPSRHSAESLSGTFPTDDFALFFSMIPSRTLVRPLADHRIRLEPKLLAQIGNLYLAGFFESRGPSWVDDARKLGVRITQDQESAFKTIWEQAKKRQGFDPSAIDHFEDQGLWYMLERNPVY